LVNTKVCRDPASSPCSPGPRRFRPDELWNGVKERVLVHFLEPTEDTIAGETPCESAAQYFAFLSVNEWGTQLPISVRAEGDALWNFGPEAGIQVVPCT